MSRLKSFTHGLLSLKRRRQIRIDPSTALRYE